MTKHKLKNGEFSEKQKEMLKEFRIKKGSLMEFALSDRSPETLNHIMGDIHTYATSAYEIVKNSRDYLLLHELAGSTPHSPCEHFDFPEPIISVREFVDTLHNKYIPPKAG